MPIPDYQTLMLPLLKIAAAHHARDSATDACRRRLPDGNSALNLAAARLRHITGTRWLTKRHLNMELLKQRNAMTV